MESKDIRDAIGSPIPAFRRVIPDVGLRPGDILRVTGGHAAMRDSSLVETIRAKLGNGDLPDVEPVKTWTGYGRGQPCIACGEAILPAQIAYEPQMPDGTSMEMHIGCHGLWIVERIRLRQDRPPLKTSSRSSVGPGRPEAR